MNTTPEEDRADVDADRRAAADQDFATARELATAGGDTAADEAVELADRAIATYLEELDDVPSAAQLRSAVEGFVVTHDDRATEVADELVALLRRTGQEDRVEEFLAWQARLLGTVTGEQTAGRRRAP